MKTALAIGLALLMPLACWAFEPQFEGEGQLMADTFEPKGSLTLPTGPFSGGAVPTQNIPGDVTRRSWRIGRGFGGTGALTAALEDQMRMQGYDVVLACETESCGGFDFRFGINVLPPPKMFVDLSDFSFLSGVKETEASFQAVWILVSQTVQAGRVQIETVSAPKADKPEKGPATPASKTDAVKAVSEENKSPNLEAFSEIGEQLERSGHVVLADLTFETGASKLADEEFASLIALAQYLQANEDTRVALVGHTDSQGALDVNTRISQQRAAAVKDRLINVYGVAAKQIEARGAGYLAPAESNRTDAGREANRRVEVVLLNTFE